jgi:hypothetical protein
MMRRKTKRYRRTISGADMDQTYLLVLQPHRNKADDIPPTRAKKTIGCHFP